MLEWYAGNSQYFAVVDGNVHRVWEDGASVPVPYDTDVVKGMCQKIDAPEFASKFKP